jgi:hypothetical protein
VGLSRLRVAVAPRVGLVRVSEVAHWLIRPLSLLHDLMTPARVHLSPGLLVGCRAVAHQTVLRSRPRKML